MKRVRCSARVNSKPLVYKTKASWLNLGIQFGVPVDVRRRIYSYLSLLDKTMVKLAHHIRADSKCIEICAAFICDNNYVELFDWLVENEFFNPYWIVKICLGSLARGFLDLAKRAHHASGGEKIPFLCSSACHSGDITILEWVEQFVTDDDYSGMAKTAAINGHVHVLEWIKAKSCQPLSNFIQTSKLPGLESVDFAKYLESEGVEIILEELFLQGFVFGRLDIMDYAIEKGYEFDPNDYNCSSTDGSIQAIQKLRKRGVIWGDDFLDRMLLQCKLNTIKWALGNGYVLDPNRPVDDHTQYYLGIRDELESFIWLYDNKFQLRVDLCQFAGPRVLKWLEQIGCFCGGKKRKISPEEPVDKDDSDSDYVE